MISNGQRPFDAFAEELSSAELFSPESKSLIYGNGKDNPPTAFMFEKQQLHGLYFNQSPAKDAALAMVSMRPTRSSYPHDGETVCISRKAWNWTSILHPKAG